MTKYFFYLMLTLGLLVYLVSFYVFKTNSVALLYISGAFSSFYFFWGAAFHKAIDRITASVLLEYFLLATSVFLLAAFFIILGF